PGRLSSMRAPRRSPLHASHSRSNRGNPVFEHRYFRRMPSPAPCLKPSADRPRDRVESGTDDHLLSPPEASPMSAGILIDNQIDIPPGIDTLDAFRRWTHSDDFPEHGRI